MAQPVKATENLFGSIIQFLYSFASEYFYLPTVIMVLLTIALYLQNQNEDTLDNSAFLLIFAICIIVCIANLVWYAKYMTCNKQAGTQNCQFDSI